MADYYPVLTRAVSSLAYNDAQARRELYARARTIIAEQLRRQNPQDLAAATTREQAALETAIRKVEAELRPVKAPAPGRPAPSRTPGKRDTAARAKAPPQNASSSLTKILKALQADDLRGGGLEISDRKPVNGATALVPSVPKPADTIGNRGIRKTTRSDELGGVPNSIGAKLLGLAYIMVAVAFTGVTYIRCIVWVAQGVIGYPTLLVVTALTLGLFIVPPVMLFRRTSAMPSFSFLLRFLYSASRRVF
jgi:hypothetical protein